MQVESCNNDADIVVPKYNYKVPAEITCNLIDVRLQVSAFSTSLILSSPGARGYVVALVGFRAGFVT